MEKTHVAILAAVFILTVALTIFVGSHYLAVWPPFSFFNLPSSISSGYNVSSDSIAFYAIWGFIGTIIALGIDTFAVMLVLRDK